MEQIHALINAYSLWSTLDIFLDLQFIRCSFYSDLKSENIMESIQRASKK